MTTKRRKVSKRRQTRRRRQRGGSKENNNLAEAIRLSILYEKERKRKEEQEMKNIAKAMNLSERMKASVKNEEFNEEEAATTTSSAATATTTSSAATTTTTSSAAKKEPLATMPQICFGTVQSNLQNSLPNALKIGYRHIDSADRYEFLNPGNREIIKNSIQSFIDQGHQREELWITWKADDISIQDIQKRIQEIGCSYFDLFLIHHYDQVKRMRGGVDGLLKILQKAKEQGLIRYFGVSNCEDINELRRLKKTYDIYANQIQARPPGGKVDGRIPTMSPTFIQECNALGVHIMFFSTMSGFTQTEFSMTYRFQEPPPSWYTSLVANINKYYIQRFLKPSNVIMVASISSLSLQSNFDNVSTFLGGTNLLSEKEMKEVEGRLKSISLAHM